MQYGFHSKESTLSGTVGVSMAYKITTLCSTVLCHNAEGFLWM